MGAVAPWVATYVPAGLKPQLLYDPHPEDVYLPAGHLVCTEAVKPVEDTVLSEVNLTVMCPGGWPI